MPISSNSLESSSIQTFEENFEIPFSPDNTVIETETLDSSHYLKSIGER